MDSWATSPRAITRDEHLGFEAPVLKLACDTWIATAKGGIPTRSQFTARTVKPFVSNVVIFERREIDYFIRLMGTRITSTLGEMQGKTLREALPEDAVIRWATELDHVLDIHKPIRVVTKVQLNHLHFLDAELFMGPMTDEHGKECMVLAAVVFSSGLRPPPSVADIIGNQ
jgi:hypothetical protein